MKKRLGLHVRLYQSLFDVLQHAQDLSIHILQIFLMSQNKDYITPSDVEIEEFRLRHSMQCDRVIVHAAYWSYVTDMKKRGFSILQKELALAEKLGCSHMVIHPGAFQNGESMKKRVKKVVAAARALLAVSESIVFLFENSPHQGKAFTGDLDEYKLFFDEFQDEPRIQMCVDTAHAFAFGYDLASDEGRQDFIQQLATKIGIANIGLIHCNDIMNELGSFQDQHAVPGEGKIGFEALYRCIEHPLLQHVPVIMELPELALEQEQQVLKRFYEKKHQDKGIV